MTRAVVGFCIAALVTVSAAARQTPKIEAHPIFGGSWSPVDPEMSDKLFHVGLSPVSGGAKLSIDQRPTRITVGFDLPDADLDLMTMAGSRWFASVVYPIARRPVGGGGAAPASQVEAVWDGEALLIPSVSIKGNQRGTMSLRLSLDGPHLDLEWQFQVLETDKVTKFVQVLYRAK